MKKLFALAVAFALALAGGWYASAPIIVQAQTNVFAGIPNPHIYAYAFSDFFGDPGATGEPFIDASSGTNSGCTAASSAANTEVGIVSCSTGTTTTGFGYTRSAGANVPLGIGQAIYFGRVQGPSALSDGTNTFSQRTGFHSAAANDIVAFLYSDSVHSGNWACETQNNGSQTTADSGVVVAAATWYDLQIVINAAGTNVLYYINGTAVCNSGAGISTNIPTGFARAVSFAPLLIQKSAGTTARTAKVDYVQYWMQFTTAR